uniref:Secreted protein n=1 Tax=Octopus bimaculoides TaxID=37653 RepID=A0A0L8GBJ6_OCTBM
MLTAIVLLLFSWGCLQLLCVCVCVCVCVRARLCVCSYVTLCIRYYRSIAANLTHSFPTGY